jgi:hypothetical protein
MLAVFGIGGWELLLIAAVFGVIVGVPLIILAIVLLVVNRQKNVARTTVEETHLN